MLFFVWRAPVIQLHKDKQGPGPVALATQAAGCLVHGHLSERERALYGLALSWLATLPCSTKQLKKLHRSTDYDDDVSHGAGATEI